MNIKYPILLLICIFPLLCVAQVEDNETLMKSVFFGGGSYYIDSEQSEELGAFLEAVPNLARYEVLIHSFTDNIGSLSYNQWLSKMRSQAVMEELSQYDLPQELIRIKDFGEQKPVYTNQTWTGRQMNRRVDVILRPITF